MFWWGLESITFSGGETIPIAHGSVTILIGPNSSGKSLSLRNIHQWLTGDGNPKPAVVSIAAEKTGTADDFHSWLNAHYPVRTLSARRHFIAKGANLEESSVGAIWNQGNIMPGAQAFLAHLLDTASRLQVSNFVDSIQLYDSPPQQYIHVLQMNDKLLKAVSSEVRAAFGEDLVINWVAGRQVGFHVGSEPPRTATKDRVSSQYAEELARLPRLDASGDGIRSFVGAVLAANCGAQPMLLIDEPEAFLHPPQARRLGAALARTAAKSNRQVIIATHSADIVQGALNASDEVAVCRVTREEDTNHGALLSSSDLSTLWSKPLLRSSAALDGLFHRGVVVCEADGDSRFYEAVLRRIEESRRVDQPIDLHFVHGGGKGGLATLAGAYASLKTRTAVVADLDLLKNKTEIGNVMASLGMDFTAYEPRYNSLVGALAGLGARTPIVDFVAQARRELISVKRLGKLPNARKRRITELLDASADWSDAKRYGIAKLRGGARTDATALVAEWASRGLFLVPVGELEGWWPEGPTAAKNDWIAAALNVVSTSGEMDKVDGFMTDVLRWFGYQVAPPAGPA